MAAFKVLLEMTHIVTWLCCLRRTQTNEFCRQTALLHFIVGFLGPFCTSDLQGAIFAAVARTSSGVVVLTRNVTIPIPTRVWAGSWIMVPSFANIRLTSSPGPDRKRIRFHGEFSPKSLFSVSKGTRFKVDNIIMEYRSVSLTTFVMRMHPTATINLDCVSIGPNLRAVGEGPVGLLTGGFEVGELVKWTGPPTMCSDAILAMTFMIPTGSTGRICGHIPETRRTWLNAHLIVYFHQLLDDRVGYMAVAADKLEFLSH
jgi:hypothetical protein